MKFIAFLKSPEKAISEWGGVEWHWSKRDAAVALAAVALVSAGLLQMDRSPSEEPPDVVPKSEVVEVVE